jgi:hypothetical protein
MKLDDRQVSSIRKRSQLKAIKSTKKQTTTKITTVKTTTHLQTKHQNL